MYTDPIYEEECKWYFYDETWAHSYRPYDTREEALEELEYYIETVLGR